MPTLELHHQKYENNQRENLHYGHFSCAPATALRYVRTNWQSVRQII